MAAHPLVYWEFCFPWPDVSSRSERLNVSAGWECWKQRKSSFEISVKEFGLNVAGACARDAIGSIWNWRSDLRINLT